MVIVQGNRVEFRFLRPEARDVFVAGDFNNWTRNQFRMSKDHRGAWRLVVFLPPGTYRFRYCADGQWFADYAAFGLRPGPYGPDGILVVGDTSNRQHPGSLRKLVKEGERRLSVRKTGRRESDTRLRTRSPQPDPAA
ncbi:MAG: hypothetical protein BIFFINMI_04192 [Phycisphaerae bacterium]|nr:hypothetical protein [Phycisphaerae bacterium]